MSEQVLEADYVIVGAGAVGMAFADTILTETNASIVLADRRRKPGGHWNDAYSFVRLHGPAANYGVNSLPLGRNRIDAAGLNRGLYNLATGAEICSYFDQVMRRRFRPSGRVTYLPMSDWRSDGVVTSLHTGARTRVRARKKLSMRHMPIPAFPRRGRRHSKWRAGRCASRRTPCRTSTSRMPILWL